MFVVFEGCDGSGKTTHSFLLHEKLATMGYESRLLHFPDRETSTGKILNRVLTESRFCDANVSHLLFSANRWEKKSSLEESLRNREILIADRYSFSGIVYSRVADPSIDMNWLKNTELGLPSPDIVFFLNKKPGNFPPSDEIYHSTEFQRNVYYTYLWVMAKEYDFLNWKVIEVSDNLIQTRDAIFTEVMKFLEARNASRSSPQSFSSLGRNDANAEKRIVVPRRLGRRNGESTSFRNNCTAI